MRAIQRTYFHDLPVTLKDCSQGHVIKSCCNSKTIGNHIRAIQWTYFHDFSVTLKGCSQGHAIKGYGNSETMQDRHMVLMTH